MSKLQWDMDMVKAISLWQPWASLIPLGLKHYETRAWKTNYRGKLLICSTAENSKHYDEYLKICSQLQLPSWSNFLHGQAIAICDLVDCIEMTPEFMAQQSYTEILCGDWQVGRYAWKLEKIQAIKEPFPVKGRQGFFNVNGENLQSESSENNIVTFGYGNRKTYDKFLEYLELFKVKVVVDIRVSARAWTRRWYGSEIQKLCQSQDVNYISRSALSNTSGSNNWIPASEKEAKQALLEISTLAQSQTILLLCGKLNSSQCHRVMVAQKLHELCDVHVRHLE
jgi:hypothetical protein